MVDSKKYFGILQSVTNNFNGMLPENGFLIKDNIKQFTESNNGGLFVFDHQSPLLVKFLEMDLSGAKWQLSIITDGIRVGVDGGEGKDIVNLRYVCTLPVNWNLVLETSGNSNPKKALLIFERAHVLF
jgi:hypothetical protein